MCAKDHEKAGNTSQLHRESPTTSVGLAGDSEGVSLFFLVPSAFLLEPRLLLAFGACSVSSHQQIPHKIKTNDQDLL